MIKIAILASGSGSNFEAIVAACKKKYFKADIRLLITDKENAFARVRAKKLGVKDIFVDLKNFSSRIEFDKYIVAILKKEKIDLVLLAGYMKIISPFFVKSFKNKILNIHPSLLPAFTGVRSIERAYNSGCKVTGVTVHFVDEQLDHGPIVLQEAIKITPKMSLLKLEKKIHMLEHKLYPLAIKLLIQNKLHITSRKATSN